MELHGAELHGLNVMVPPSVLLYLAILTMAATGIGHMGYVLVRWACRRVFGSDRDRRRAFVLIGIHLEMVERWKNPDDAWSTAAYVQAARMVVVFRQAVGREHFDTFVNEMNAARRKLHPHATRIAKWIVANDIDVAKMDSGARPQW